VKDGRIQEDELRRARMSHSQLLAYVHATGGETLDEVKHAFVERSGTVTVVLR
jgi:uncharacterized membrane protein YcaP (DUF421 family)